MHAHQNVSVVRQEIFVVLFFVDWQKVAKHVDNY